MKIICFLFVCFLFLSACDSPCNTPITAVGLGFYISDSSNDSLFWQQYLGKFPKDSIKFFYKSQSGIHLDSFTLVKRTDLPANQNVYDFSSADVLNQSVSGIKTFYFERNFNVIDTIYFDERLESGNCHIYKVYAIKYNGMDISNNGHTVIVKR